MRCQNFRKSNFYGNAAVREEKAFETTVWEKKEKNILIVSCNAGMCFRSYRNAQKNNHKNVQNVRKRNRPVAGTLMEFERRRRVSNDTSGDLTSVFLREPKLLANVKITRTVPKNRIVMERLADESNEIDKPISENEFLKLAM